jgi:hypothetical protein
LKKILLIFVLTLLFLRCDEVQLAKNIVEEINECDEYSVKYHSTNNCNDFTNGTVYITSEEYERLFNLVSNALPVLCVFVTITPKNGGPIKIGYIKDLESFLKITKSDGSLCN